MTLTLIALLSGLRPACAEDPKNSAPAVQQAVKEPSLREELLQRMKAEQDVRFEVMQLSPPNKPLTPEERQRPSVKAAHDKMEKIDKDNLAWLKAVVDKHGWPGRSLVGPDGANAAFLIAQHSVSDLDFMTKCLGLLKKSYKTGDAEGQWVALMTDRLLIAKDKKKQLYGTQLMAKEGKLVPQPIEDEANVDQRRKELGMISLADYLKLANGQALPPGQPAPTKSAGAKQR